MVYVIDNLFIENLVTCLLRTFLQYNNLKPEEFRYKEKPNLFSPFLSVLNLTNRHVCVCSLCVSR